MKKVFISYRRSDSQDITDRIYDYLAEAFGKEVIFKDVDSIDFGENFKQKIATAIKASSVVIVVIGRNWLNSTDGSGLRRLDNPNDYVRTEVETAIVNNVPVLLVLVSNTAMPSPGLLPPSLQAICEINAINVRPDPDFRSDVSKLIESIKALTGLTVNGEGRRKKKVLSLIAGIGIAAAVTATIVYFLMNKERAPDDLGHAPFNIKVHIVHGDNADSLINEGKAILYVGNETKTVNIRDGEAMFYNIPASYNNKKVKLLTAIRNFELEHNNEILLSKEEGYVEVRVKRAKEADVSHVRGSIVNENGTPVKNVAIDFANGLATGSTDQNGNFFLDIPLPPGTKARLRIRFNNTIQFNEDVTLSSEVPMNLKIRTKL